MNTESMLRTWQAFAPGYGITLPKDFFVKELQNHQIEIYSTSYENKAKPCTLVQVLSHKVYGGMAVTRIIHLANLAQNTEALAVAYRAYAEAAKVHKKAKRKVVRLESLNADPGKRKAANDALVRAYAILTEKHKSLQALVRKSHENP